MRCHPHCFCLFTYLLLCQKGLSSMNCMGWYLTSKDCEFPYMFRYFEYISTCKIMTPQTWKLSSNLVKDDEKCYLTVQILFSETSPKASSLRRRRIDAQLCFQFPPENQHILIPSTSWHLRLPETFKFQHVYQHFLRDLAAASLSRISRHRQHFDCGLTSWDPQVKLDLGAMFGN